MVTEAAPLAPADPQVVVLTDILEWSKGRPAWIRESLRMLVTQPEGLSETDIAHLADICKREAGIPAEEIQANGFSEEHIAVRATPDETISLLGIRDVQGVNALAPNTSLGFEPDGINLVYGDNGAGKSSYARILKDNCRCAAPSHIQPNVFEAPAHKEAKIGYIVDKTPAEFVWTANATCPPHLGSIRVFDSRCAEVYVNEEREASFTPYGIGILSALADRISPSVKDVLANEKNALVRKLPDLSTMVPDQQAKNFVTALTAETRLPLIDSWTTFTQEDDNELNQLHAVLSIPDPQQQIRVLESRVTRINQLTQWLTSIETYFSQQGIATLKALSDDRTLKRQTADQALAVAFGDTPVVGTGSPDWRQMWDAARKFVETTSYPHSAFPNTERCPLCQQELGENPLGLMNRFEEYIKGDIESQAQAAQTALDNHWAQLHQVSLVIATYQPLLSELGPEATTLVLQFIQSAETIKNQLGNAIQHNTWDQLPALLESPRQYLLNMAIPINGQIEALKLGANPEQRLAQQGRYNQLASRKALQPYKAAIVAEVERLLLVANYDTAISSCNSRAISTKSGALAEAYVTPEIQKAFTDRLQQLFGDRCFVTLEKTKTAVGVTYFRLKLADAVYDIPIVDVASEGEFRAIALAAFLAETDLARDSCGVVLDDPVSSLDHRFRERFARIIREVGKTRQVIIFTHDLFFLSCIIYHANRNSESAPHCIELKSMGGKHGYPQQGAPFEVQKFKPRRNHILSEIDAAKKCLETGDFDGCMRIAHSLTPKMRKIAERVVEEVLFNGAVVRYDPAIHTTKLDSRLLVIEEKDIKLIVDLMDKYSLQPHDQAPDRKPDQPDIAVLENDINTLQDWVTDFRKRAKAQELNLI